MEAGIEVLIGSDKLWKFVTAQIIRNEGVSGLVAIDIKIAWTLQGPTQQGSLCNKNQALVCVLSASGWCESESTSAATSSFLELDFKVPHS